jgi:hypothetical protein
MRIELRAVSEKEAAKPLKNISWFEINQRRLARREVAAGFVEELVFTVSRAWKEFTCEGAPCCPNAWLLETADRRFVQIDSWETLSPANSNFPGENVAVVRWPQTLRVISAVANGNEVKSEDLPPQAMNDMPEQYIQCRLFEPADLPASVREITGGLTPG